MPSMINYLFFFFWLEQGFVCGGTDKMMFIKKRKDKFLVAQVYVDDIVF